MSVPETSRRDEPDVEVDLEVLESVQRRVLWLATSIVHHANNVRDTASGVKVGGHQASSASIGLDHDRAVLRPPAGTRPRVGQAPCVARSPRHRISAGRAGRALPDDACASSAACRAIPAGSRTPFPPTSRPARSGSEPRRRSGARSPTGTSPATSRFPGRAAGRAAWATPSWTREHAGRRSSTPWSHGSARSCGSSTSTASRSTGSFPTSPPTACGDVRGRRMARDQTVKYGRRLRASCSIAPAARRCAAGSIR